MDITRKEATRSLSNTPKQCEHINKTREINRTYGTLRGPRQSHRGNQPHHRTATASGYTCPSYTETQHLCSFYLKGYAKKEMRILLLASSIIQNGLQSCQ